MKAGQHASIDLGLDTTEDILGLVVGNLIGEGQFRRVFSSAYFGSEVVKISKEGQNVSNVLEYELWQVMKGTKFEKFLAPCLAISPNGCALVQKRCQPLKEKPKLVPSFLGDLKLDNWGLFEGRPVAFDYGSRHIFTLLAEGARMVKGNWHRGT